MLETSNLARKYAPIYSFRKYTFQCLVCLDFADVSIFFCKKFAVFVQKSTFTQSNNMRAVLEIFQFCFQFFVRQKVTVAENITLQILCPESGLQTAPNWPKIQKMTMTSHFSDMTSTSIFLTICFSCRVQLLVQVSFQYHYQFWNHDNFLL